MWRPVPGYEGTYEASDNGQVRAVRAHPKARTEAGHVLRPQQHANGYLNVGLQRGGVRKVVGVHRIVASAFHGEPEPGMEACHRDGDKTNNAASNLRWGTHAENVAETVQAGNHYSHNGQKTECDHGHEFTPENTRVYTRDGGERRECRTCRREISKRARQRAARNNEGDN